MRYKHNNFDKWSGHINQPTKFVQSNWLVSMEQEYFHLRRGWVQDKKFSATYSIETKVYRASSHGESVDGMSYAVGKTDV